MAQEQVLQYCRLCKSSRIKLIFRREDIFIFKCIDCGVVFLGNSLDEKTIKELYGYYKNNISADCISTVTKLHYKKLLDSFEKYRKNNSIIDVGCGAGYFMLSASENGWDVDGTEVSCEAVKLAVKKGQKVFKGDISSLELGKGKYDVVTLLEVIEHTNNPENVIKKISQMLRPGGAVYITTPNYNSITRIFLGNRWGIFHKEHIFYFTIRELSLLLNKHGFKIKKIMAKNLSLREILNIFKACCGPLDNSAVFGAQERIRSLTERKGIFFILKRLINFILNISRTGETIYILAEKH